MVALLLSSLSLSQSLFFNIFFFRLSLIQHSSFFKQAIKSLRKLNYTLTNTLYQTLLFFFIFISTSFKHTSTVLFFQFHLFIFSFVFYQNFQLFFSILFFDISSLTTHYLKRKNKSINPISFSCIH